MSVRLPRYKLQQLARRQEAEYSSEDEAAAGSHGGTGNHQIEEKMQMEDPMEPGAPQPSSAPVDAAEHGWTEKLTADGLPYFHNVLTDELTWDRPKSLSAASSGAERDEIPQNAAKGDWYWIPDPEEAFRPGLLIADYDNGKALVEFTDGKQKTIRLPNAQHSNSKLQRLSGVDAGGKKAGGEAESSETYAGLHRLHWPQLLRNVDDLVMLESMNEPLILHTLRKRFQKNQIYTNIGSILISINPYKLLGLYTPEMLQVYLGSNSRRRGGKHSEAVGGDDGDDDDGDFREAQERFHRLDHIKYNPANPHTFGIAAAAYRTPGSQSIVISGESGAGKTECTKQCLQFLTRKARSTKEDLHTRILQVNPILEAFGNAKTIRNDNSSRFGKWIELCLDEEDSICGAFIVNYLLEKTRVVAPHAEERNFHIFYQLLKGVDRTTRRVLGLGEDPSFCAEVHYINRDPHDLQGDTRARLSPQTADGEEGEEAVVGENEDVREFREVERAFQLLGVPEEEKLEVYRIVAAVLHIGNCSFRKLPNGAIVAPTAGTALKKAAELLHFPEKELRVRLEQRTLKIPGQKDTHVPFQLREAEDNRDALAKFIYAYLFDWIVQRCNESIKGGEGMLAGRKRSIGILDIFGFEIFEQNSFEQLCINFANEKLQQFFNQHTFRLEEELYREEEVKFDHVNYQDNQPVLELIQGAKSGGRGVSILALLDEELRLPRGSDEGFVTKLLGHHVGEERNARRKNDASTEDKRVLHRVLSDPMHFQIRHYAGKVIYDSAQFLDKNRDVLSEDLLELLALSESSFLKKIVPGSASGGAGRKASLGAQFGQQLDTLMGTLRKTHPHYIRCIKPNDDKLPMTFEGPLVLQQLRYSGVFEAVEIRKRGFPFKLSHEDFFFRYRSVLSHHGGERNFEWTTCWKQDGKGNPVDYKEGIRKILQVMGLESLLGDEIRMGKTKLLYRGPEHQKMELHRCLADERLTRTAQRIWRGYFGRKLGREMSMRRAELETAAENRDLLSLEAGVRSLKGMVWPQSLRKAFSRSPAGPWEQMYAQFGRPALDLSAQLRAELQLETWNLLLLSEVLQTPLEDLIRDHPDPSVTDRWERKQQKRRGTEGRGTEDEDSIFRDPEDEERSRKFLFEFPPQLQKLKSPEEKLEFLRQAARDLKIPSTSSSVAGGVKPSRWSGVEKVRVLADLRRSLADWDGILLTQSTQAAKELGLDVFPSVQTDLKQAEVVFQRIEEERSDVEAFRTALRTGRLKNGDPKSLSSGELKRLVEEHMEVDLSALEEELEAELDFTTGSLKTREARRLLELSRLLLLLRSAYQGAVGVEDDDLWRLLFRVLEKIRTEFSDFTELYSLVTGNTRPAEELQTLLQGVWSPGALQDEEDGPDGKDESSPAAPGQEKAEMEEKDSEHTIPGSNNNSHRSDGDDGEAHPSSSSPDRRLDGRTRQLKARTEKTTAGLELLAGEQDRTEVLRELLLAREQQLLYDFIAERLVSSLESDVPALELSVEIAGGREMANSGHPVVGRGKETLGKIRELLERLEKALYQLRSEGGESPETDDHEALAGEAAAVIRDCSEFGWSPAEEHPRMQTAEELLSLFQEACQKLQEAQDQVEEGLLVESTDFCQTQGVAERTFLFTSTLELRETVIQINADCRTAMAEEWTPRDEDLQQILDRAVAVRLDTPELRELKAHLQSARNCSETLAQASLPPRDQSGAEEGLETAADLKLSPELWPAVAEAQAVLGKILELREQLDYAMEVVDEYYLREAVYNCQEFQYDTEQVRAARDLRDKVIQLNLEAPEVLETLEPELMSDVLYRADRIGLSTEAMEMIREYLFSIGEQEFAQRQLRAAVRLQDQGRIRRLTTVLKDLLFLERHDDYRFTRFPKLLSPQEWAGHKLIPLGLEELARSCHSWTKDPIHHSLTRLPKRVKSSQLGHPPPVTPSPSSPDLSRLAEQSGGGMGGGGGGGGGNSSSSREAMAQTDRDLQVESKKSFRRLQEWMGDRKVSDKRKKRVRQLGLDPSNGTDGGFTERLEAAWDFLEQGIGVPQLRDEMYCQVVKQMTKNPSQESQLAGWRLLRMSFDCFVPTEALENYFELWLRDNADHELVMIFQDRIYTRRTLQEPPPRQALREICRNLTEIPRPQPFPRPWTGYRPALNDFEDPDRMAAAESEYDGPKPPEWHQQRLCEEAGIHTDYNSGQNHFSSDHHHHHHDDHGHGYDDYDQKKYGGHGQEEEEKAFPQHRGGEDEDEQGQMGSFRPNHPSRPNRRPPRRSSPLEEAEIQNTHEDEAENDDDDGEEDFSSPPSRPARRPPPSSSSSSSFPNRPPRRGKFPSPAAEEEEVEEEEEIYEEEEAAEDYEDHGAEEEEEYYAEEEEGGYGEPVPGGQVIGDWASAIDPESGDTYFYHQITGETTWDPPPGFEDDHPSPEEEDWE